MPVFNCLGSVSVFIVCYNESHLPSFHLLGLTDCMLWLLGLLYSWCPGAAWVGCQSWRRDDCAWEDEWKTGESYLSTDSQYWICALWLSVWKVSVHYRPIESNTLLVWPRGAVDEIGGCGLYTWLVICMVNIYLHTSSKNERLDCTIGFDSHCNSILAGSEKVINTSQTAFNGPGFRGWCCVSDAAGNKT